MYRISVTAEDRKGIYEELLPQIVSLIEGENDMIANMANMSSALKEAFGFLWVGFYIVRHAAGGDMGELVLGPFQGPVACSRIKYGKGVCGMSWSRAETIIVDDVTLFPGHIACSPYSRSEIVVPLLDAGGNVFAVMDIDSTEKSDFSAVDRYFLEILAGKICRLAK